MNNIIEPIPSSTTWNRNYLNKILSAAIETGENRFAHQLALSWLAYFPGDLAINLIRAKSLNADGVDDQALPILKKLTKLDPEYREAQDLLYKVNSNLNEAGLNSVLGCSVALGKIPKHIDTLTSKEIGWSYTLALTRKLIAKKDYQNAEKYLQQVLGEASHTPLCGITHLHLLIAQENTSKNTLQKLAEHYHNLWPECLQFSLILADTLMDSGEMDRAVSLLHQAASQDITGQVAKRIWGTNNPYNNLWPKQLEAPIFTQIPSSVAAYFGWNLLPSSDIHLISVETDIQQKQENQISQTTDSSSEKLEIIENDLTDHSPSDTLVNPKEAKKVNFISIFRDLRKLSLSKSETLNKIRNKLDDLSSKRNQTIQPNKEGRFPVYVVFTTQNGLHMKYGEKTTVILEQAIQKLIASIRKRLDWGAILIYADNPVNMAQYGLKPVPSDDPWKLKLALTDLDTALGKRGARIGALLIVGGSDVVPFHNLPNPTDDTDSCVPSDNPYSTTDENYFVPEWPVGRIPGGTGTDPGLLLSTIRSITERHNNIKSRPESLFLLIWEWLLGIINSKVNKSQNSFGYSAEAWQQASGFVFRPIGDPKSLVTSPPVAIHAKQPLPKTKLGYFNLHGVVDSAEWFGQRDPRNGENGPDFPVAIHPKNVLNGDRSPKVIFSEACFGAHILNKSIDEALSLKFLASGSQAIVGSTVISYGSVTTPLNAADLLGRAFWDNFSDGYPAGEALRRAKIFLIKEMHQRQGYLDGEDQKTLISFVLYGDPLTQESELGQRKLLKKFPEILQLPKDIKTICDRVDIPGTSEALPKEVIGNIKKIVDQYLPGMRNAKFWISHEHAECCSEGHVCPTSQLGVKTKLSKNPERRVVTLNKQVVKSKLIHESYARLTLDKQGNVVKLAVSR